MLSLLYVSTLTSIMTAGKTVALTTDLVNKVMSLLFNTLSMLVITFLPRSKRLLIPCNSGTFNKDCFFRQRTEL